MELLFKTYKQFKEENEYFPNKYHIAIAQKYHFLIYQKESRRLPSLFLNQSMKLFIDFINYQKGLDYSESETCSPIELASALDTEFIPFTVQDIGSLAKLGVFQSTIKNRGKKHGKEYSAIKVDSYYPVIEFHRACIERLDLFRNKYTQINVNDWGK